MVDWKGRIDEYKVKKEQEEEEREDAKKRALKEKEELETQRLLQELGKKFKCHICKIPSKKPYRSPGRNGEKFSDGEIGFWPDTPEGSDQWDKPGDLFKCSNCDKWSCEEHIYKRICMKCAERL